MTKVFQVTWLNFNTIIIYFYSCATIPLSSEILEHFSHVHIQHTQTDKLPILLPPDLQHVCSMNHCVPSLLELALRVASDNMHPTGILLILDFVTPLSTFHWALWRTALVKSFKTAVSKLQTVNKISCINSKII